MKARVKSSVSLSPAVSPPPARTELFARLAEHEHEQVSLYYEPSTGYRGIIAIHSTVLGPALGGTRFWHYASDVEALVDALRLSRGMTYKAAVAGLNLGGGKSVIIGDHTTTRREPLFRALLRGLRPRDINFFGLLRRHREDRHAIRQHVGGGDGELRHQRRSWRAELQRL